MRRLFVMPERVFHGKVTVGKAFKDGSFHEVEVPLHQTANPLGGSYYIDLIPYTSEANALLKHDDPKAWEQLPEVKDWRSKDSHILLSTRLDHSEAMEDLWVNHPDIAFMPHPVNAGRDKISAKKPEAAKPKVGDDPREEELDPMRKIKSKHIDALKAHHTMGFDDNDDVNTLAAKAQKVNCLVKLSRNPTL